MMNGWNRSQLSVFWLAAALVLGGGSLCRADDQPEIFRVRFEVGRGAEGTVVAIRAVIEGEAQATCGSAEVAEWVEAGEARETAGLPVTYRDDALDCEVTLTWQRGGTVVRVRGPELETGKPDSPAVQRRDGGRDPEASQHQAHRASDP